MELVGQRFGHIRVTGVVGRGGMGKVYSGYDETLQRRVAVKVLHEDVRLDHEARERLLREARSLSKLDHPNICRIHDYIDSDDADLLVLEYIEGRTLHEALADTTSRAEKLRIAISIAEVLVAAHRASIVHRDLKPENVMLTKSGEVKVLDFGLARWLNRTRHTAPVFRVVRREDGGGAEKTLALSDSPSDRRTFLATEAGTALGTPLYMSPEQARGEELTTASDMFAFGLMLQVLFTGKEPHPEGASGREVMLRVARGETEPAEGAPGDITALINQLKSLAAADRPTAVQTLERLHHLDEKPRRIARRAIVAALLLLVVFGVWRYTVDLKRERAAAVAAEAAAQRERAEAQRRRAQAEELVDFMMGDLHRKLAPIARLDALDAAADRSLSYIATLRPEVMSADDLGRNATALQHVGEVRMAQGKLPESLRAFEMSLSLAQQAVAKNPRKPALRYTLGQQQFYVGESNRLMGNSAVALARMRDYLGTSQELARIAPANADYQVELAYGYSNVGSLLEANGDLGGALEQYQRCLAIKEARLRLDPWNREWQADLAPTINKIAYALQKQGQMRRARAQFEREKSLLADVVRSDPQNNTWKQMLVNSDLFLGPMYVDFGEIDRAANELQEARSLAEALVKFDATQVSWRRDLAVALAGLSIVERLHGRATRARELAQRAETLLRAALVDAPDRTSWRRDLARIIAQHAEAQYASGDSGAAKRQAEEVLELIPPGTTDPSWRLASADASLLLGRIAAERGRKDESRLHWQRVADSLNDIRSVISVRRLADRRARALVLLGRDAEAAPLIAELRRLEYANPDFVVLAAAGGETSSQ